MRNKEEHIRQQVIEQWWRKYDGTVKALTIFKPVRDTQAQFWRELRESRGLSQAEAARVFGITRQMQNKVETGRTCVAPDLAWERINALITFRHGRESRD